MNNEQMIQEIQGTIPYVPNFYIAEFTRSGVGAFSGNCFTRFFAKDYDALQEQLNGLIDTFCEEFPEAQYPDREMKFIGVYKQVNVKGTGYEN